MRRAFSIFREIVMDLSIRTLIRKAAGLIPPKDNSPIKVKVNRREMDTIIAALYLWQNWHNPEDFLESSLIDIAQENGERLSDSEVDSLIERIN